MCGIVGYTGNRNTQDILVSGLKRLEYRGYDSSGIVTVNDDGEALRLRAVGKVAELANLVASNASDATTGIGHTRWATHGVPSEANAHPHQAGDVYLVHNGIIENYKELKAELTNHKFVSETDTEVLAALINELYQRSDVKLENAVTQALKLVRGTYGIGVISTREPGKVVVARAGSPLIIGIGEDETVIASDASALIGHTDQAIYLNDGELAICTAGNVVLLDLASQPVSAKIETIEVDMQAIQKQGYDHFLLKEIMEQPDTLASTLSGRVDTKSKRINLGGLNLTDEQLRDIKHVVIVGCGTAYYAGLLASYYLEKVLDGVTTEVVIASEYRYRAFTLPENTVALIVSQSGETADTLACMREIKRRGAICLGVINAVGSTIAREVDGGIYVHAGPEISVASTKAFTSQTSAMIMFGLMMAQSKGVALEETSKYVDELAKLPKEIKAALKATQDEIKDITDTYKGYDHALFVGRDVSFPVALEGALKLKEVSYVHAEAYPFGELKHGPIALIDDRFFEVAILNDDWLLDKSLSGLAEINARGGHSLVITNSDAAIDAETIVRVDTSLKLLSPLVLNVVLQLFAYYVAVSKGNDVDQPRNLAKSVTVE
jgi:glucosamine--fructose-6-phosphate aminotransferase (isomerizing)